jgi:hypothetical protein
MLRVPNMQNLFYEPHELPKGMHRRGMSVSGGRVLFSDGMTIERALTETPYRIRRKIEQEFPDRSAYQDAILVIDIEHPINPGKLEHPTPEFLERLAGALEIRFALLREWFGHATEILAWVAGRAWQEDQAIDDDLEVASLIHLARLGAFRNTTGFAVRCYPAIPPTAPGWPKHEEAIDHAVRSTRAIAEAAENVDNAPRCVMAQIPFIAYTRDGQIPLEPQDIQQLEDSANKAGADIAGFWSAPGHELTPKPTTIEKIRDLHLLTTSGNS